jgi:serine/threonine protein kinase
VKFKGLQYAQSIRDDQPLTGHFGYHYSWYAFKAPEVDSNFVHDKSVDLWSLGAIMCMLLTGLPPFRQNGLDLVQAKHAGIVEFEPVNPSGSAQRLVKGLLQVQPEYRFTIDDVLNHEWMIQDDKVLEGYDLSLALVFIKDFQRTSA